MPSSGYTLEGSSITEMLCPSFRSVDYSHTELSQDRAMITVTNILRDFWRLQPAVAVDHALDTDDQVKDAMPGFMRAWSQYSDGEKAAIATNEDTSDTGNVWRRGVYRLASHVFVDAYGFLAESGGSARYGHYHPPNNEVLVLADGPEDVRCWEKNHVMLLPIYLAKGVTVKIMKISDDGEAVEKAKFDEESPYVTWFIRAKEKWKLAFERGEGSEPLDGPAAVVVVGISCEKEVLSPEEAGDHDDLPSVDITEGSMMAQYGESNQEKSE